MIQIGRRIFFDINTGNIILDTGEKIGHVVVTTIEQDISSYKTLSDRNRDTFDVIELEYGQYAQDFAEGRLIGVNVETKIPIFEYPNPENPEEPIIAEKPLSVEIQELKQETTAIRIQSAQSNAELFEMMLMMMGGGIA